MNSELKAADFKAFVKRFMERRSRGEIILAQFGESHEVIWRSQRLRSVGTICRDASPSQAERGRGGRGAFVSITEQQTGPLEMKGSEWSQSKRGPARGSVTPPTAVACDWGRKRINVPPPPPIDVTDKTCSHTNTPLTISLTICYHSEKNVSHSPDSMFHVWGQGDT